MYFIEVYCKISNSQGVDGVWVSGVKFEVSGMRITRTTEDQCQWWYCSDNIRVKTRVAIAHGELNYHV